MRAAIVENDVVVNVINVMDLSFPVAAGQQLIEAPRDEVEIGWIRQPDGTFAPEVQE